MIVTGRKSRNTHHRRLARASLPVLAIVATVAGVVPGASAAPEHQVTKTVPFAAHHKQRLYPKLPASVARAGSAIVSFRTPVTVHGKGFAHNAKGNAGSTALAHLNSTLASLGTTHVQRLFTNLPASKLATARARAERNTGRYVTDFTQVYQVDYNPKINSGTAANRLAASSLLSSAMPNFRFTVPTDSARLSAAQVRSALATLKAAKDARRAAVATDLPGNASYSQDAQSYQDAASDSVTGAASMIAKKYGQQPGQGETVTNISLGTVDDTSTVLEGGQRYIEEAGYPKIPVYLSSESCTGSDQSTCTITLDPSGTNTGDGQGDFTEVNLDFSVMAPPPLGDPRMVNPPPAGKGELLGSAYGANYRLINPKQNSTPNFVAAFLGGGFLQSPAPSVITASIGSGFSIGGFSDYFFENEALIHDAVTTLVQGADIFVSISAGDGQTNTNVAMNPNGLTEPTQVTTDPSRPTDIDDPAAWANPSYSYGLTNQPHYVIDSGANDAGANTLNDVFNNSPWNTEANERTRHSEHTTETRWTGQQNFHTGSGTRVTLSAPGDDVVFLAQVEGANGIPVNPVATFPRLVGGSSASAPQVAGAAAVVRQAARLTGQSLSAVAVRTLLQDTGRKNIIPAFDLSKANIGPAIDLTAAVQSLFDHAGVSDTPTFARMTVAERKTVLTYTDFRSSFWTDTEQDAAAHTATIDLSQGLVAPSSRINETVGQTGDNVFAPITFAADPEFMASSAYRWTLSLDGAPAVSVPSSYFDKTHPSLRLLPSEIFGLLGAPVTSAGDRVVTVTAKNGSASIATAVTFKGAGEGADATHMHAIPPSFQQVFTKGQQVTVHYDLRDVRDGSGGLVDGGELIVSDIDRAVPQAFPDNDVNVHGFKRTLPGLVGTITLSAKDFPHGVGTYGLALRGTKGGSEIVDTSSLFLPLRFAPTTNQVPSTPKVQAAASILNGSAPLFYDVADIEPGGSNVFAVKINVSRIRGATGAIVEFSAPTYDFAKALFITGNFGPSNSLVNNFTNPLGDRIDKGDNFGQPGETSHRRVNGTNGYAVFSGPSAGLKIPGGKCDSTYQVRVFATDAQGKIIGVASDGSVFSYGNFGKAVCFS